MRVSLSFWVACMWAVLAVVYVFGGDHSAARESALLSVAFVILAEIRERP